MAISPIKLQRRMAELGRVRLGAKEGGKGRPMKLASFRFTSPSESYIKDLATLYGGEPRQWDNNGKPEWEVFTTAASIPVIAVKGGLSQWMETWSGGGCVHRCDGERDVEGNLCDPNDRNHLNAKPTTRLSMMLPELEAIGVFRLESHGWNAAAEIPAVAELAQFVGELVPAHLHLVERRSVKDGKTSRFVVPVLDLQIGAARLREIVAEKSGLALAAPGTAAPAIEAPKTADTPQRDYKAEADDVTALDALSDLWRQASVAGALDDDLRGYLTARADQIKAQAAPQANPDGTYDAEVVEEPPVPSDPAAQADPDAIWHQILARTGQLGWDLTKTQADFAASIGVDSGEASTGELQTYLTRITTGEEPAA